MWNRFCPLINGICTDGQPAGSKLPCAHWDSLNSECVTITQALLSVAFHRRTLTHMDELEDLQQDMLTRQKALEGKARAGLPINKWS